MTYQTQIRMKDEQYRRIKRIYGAHWNDHESSWNAWMVNMMEIGIKEYLTAIKEEEK